MFRTCIRSRCLNRSTVAWQLPLSTATTIPPAPSRTYTTTTSRRQPFLPFSSSSLSTPKKSYTTASSMGQHYKPTIDSHVVKVFVLETDTPHPNTQTERGSFGEILHHHFSVAGRDHHPPLGVETEQVFVVTEEGGRMPKVEEFDDYDGLLITGSMYDAHGDNPWIHELLDLLKQLWTKRPDFHFTGVCFGHQVLSRLLGGKVGPSPSNDWELGHNAITLTPVGKRLFRTHDDKVYLHQMHQDQVLEGPSIESSNGLLPPNTDIHIWGKSDHTPIQGLYIPNRLFTTQAHLAFDEDMVKRQIQMRVDSGGIKDLEHADRASETADLEHDGDMVASAILRLFKYDDDGMKWD